MPLRILIVDDHIEDPHKLISELPAKLRKEGYDVWTTARSSEAYDLVWKYRPHLIVLDMLFPRQVLQGIDIVEGIRLQEEREREGKTPIILISEPRTATDDIVAGLKAGADDYAAHKDNREILARVRRHLPPEVYEPDDYLAVQLANRGVWVKRDGSWQKVHLGRLEFDLLEALITNAGRPLGSTALKLRLREDEEYMSDEFLLKLVSTLRSKLEPYPEHPGYIETLKGLGYQFNDRLTRTGSARPPTDFPMLSDEQKPDILMLSELLGLPHVRVIGYQIAESESIEMRIKSSLAETVCPACGQTTTQIQNPDELLMLRDLPIWGRRCWLSYRLRRFACPVCRNTFVEQIQWSEADSAYTARFLEHICERTHHEDTSWIAYTEGLSQETVQRIAERPAKTDQPRGATDS